MRRLWRGLAIFILGGVLGTGFGVALGFFLFPFVFPPPPAMDELTLADVAPLSAPATPSLVSPTQPAPVIADTPAASLPSAPAASTPPPAAPTPPPAASGMPAPPPPAPIARGTFIHANPSDPVHWGRGTVSAYERTIFLESNFEVGPGPKYHVYLVPRAGVRNEDHVNKSMFVDLGRLRAFKGSQRYPVPAGVNLKDYKSVVIWCERFGVLISPADLMVAGR